MSAIEVTKAGGESNSSLMRRFSKRVQLSGNIKTARGLRYRERAKSELKKKKEALKKQTKRAHYERLKKLGKLKDA